MSAYVLKILLKARLYAVDVLFRGQVKKRLEEYLRCSETLNDYVDPRLNTSICTTYM